MDQAKKAHDIRMKHDPVYRMEWERRQKLREIAVAQYEAAVRRVQTATDEELSRPSPDPEP